jgi:hypothetical protein
MLGRGSRLDRENCQRRFVRTFDFCEVSSRLGLPQVVVFLALEGKSILFVHGKSIRSIEHVFKSSFHEGN